MDQLQKVVSGEMVREIFKPRVPSIWFASAFICLGTSALSLSRRSCPLDRYGRDEQLASSSSDEEIWILRDWAPATFPFMRLPRHGRIRYSAEG